MENKFKINFRQQKYMLPLITYPFVIGTLYLFCDLFNTDLAEAPSKMKTTEYLNSDLPEANVNEDLGDKSSNMLREYGKISDFTAIDGVEKDSVKKEGYESKYTDEEARQIQEEELKRKAKEEEAKRQSELEKAKKEKEAERRKNLAKSTAGNIFDNDELLSRLSPEDRRRLEELRSNRRGKPTSSDVSAQQGGAVATDASQLSVEQSLSVAAPKRKDVQEIDKDSKAKTVTKKNTKESIYFNTISSNQKESNLIKAIIDENIKATEGSRVRLRLLDDVEVDGVQLKKGTYLYATMNGFGSQRVKGKVESVLVDDELIKISLSLYDMDGLEGLYVPESAFRETVQDAAGDMAGQSMTFDNSSSGSVSQWVQQAYQGAYQKVSQSISKAIKKKKAKLKYGTHVYLINGQPKDKKRQ